MCTKYIILAQSCTPSTLLYRCVDFVTSSGQCVDQCEDGFHINVFPNTTLSARVCEGKSYTKQQHLLTSVIIAFNYCIAGGNTSGSSSTLPQWAIIVIAVMAGLVILTGLVVLLVFSFTWFNRARYIYTYDYFC